MSGFTFKQFHVNHNRCAMKVGTDGILLGAWADIGNVSKILDMGTGSGLVALMLAQRTASDCQITAVELEQAAYLQAQENMAQSPWQHKMKLVQQDVLLFCQQYPQKFDLIVANPPYFSQGVACKNQAREQARYMQQQSHLSWLNAAQYCLTDSGKITMVLPIDAAKTLIKQTALYCVKQTEVVTKQGKMPQRMLVSFSPHFFPLEQDQLTIYDAENRYTDEFIALTRAFYLKF